jgi:Na+/phosphate symporter
MKCAVLALLLSICGSFTIPLPLANTPKRLLILSSEFSADQEDCPDSQTDMGGLEQAADLTETGVDDSLMRKLKGELDESYTRSQQRMDDLAETMDRIDNKVENYGSMATTTLNEARDKTIQRDREHESIFRLLGQIIRLSIRRIFKLITAPYRFLRYLFRSK